MKNRETDEWLKQNLKSTREFIRKWGHFCKHDALMKPIIPPKYDIGFIVKNCNIKLLEALEPWCSTLYMDNWAARHEYLYQEKSETSYDLGDKIRNINNYDRAKENEILIAIDGNNITNQDFQILQQLSEIIQDSGEKGEFNIGNLDIKIFNTTTYENKLITCKE